MVSKGFPYVGRFFNSIIFPLHILRLYTPVPGFKTGNLTFFLAAVFSETINDDGKKKK